MEPRLSDQSTSVMKRSDRRAHIQLKPSFFVHFIGGLFYFSFLVWQFFVGRVFSLFCVWSAAPRAFPPAALFRSFSFGSGEVWENRSVGLPSCLFTHVCPGRAAGFLRVVSLLCLLLRLSASCPEALRLPRSRFPRDYCRVFGSGGVLFFLFGFSSTGPRVVKESPFSGYGQVS